MDVKSSVLYIPVDGFLRQYLTLNHGKYKIMVNIHMRTAAVLEEL